MRGQGIFLKHVNKLSHFTLLDRPASVLDQVAVTNKPFAYLAMTHRF